ncbi:MAG TPA: DUF4836 family protein [Sediminibacterium sp.]|nr:DUF4836 family protein [Sediminibacterium sp.]
MKSFAHILLVSCTALLLFSSCSNKAPKEARYIPKDASLVLSIDPGQLKEKLQNGGITIDTLISYVFSKDSTDQKDKAKLKDLRENAGINWESQVFFFFNQKAYPDESHSTTFSIIAGLKDAGKFETFLKKQHSFQDKNVVKQKDYSYAANDDHTMASWNDQQLIITFYNHPAKLIPDTSSMQQGQPQSYPEQEEMKQEVNRYYTQKTSESMADQSVFTGMFKDRADGYMYTNSSASLASLSMLPLQLPKLDELIKDNYSTATLNFENGRILAKSASFTNPMLTSILKQYSGPTVSLPLIEHYPSAHVNSVMMASFNPEMIGGIMKQLEVEGLANNFLEKAGLSSQDIYHSLKGDMAIVVSDIGMHPTASENTQGKGLLSKFGKVLITAPVGDTASFRKIMDKAVDQGLIVKDNDHYRASGFVSAVGIFVRADTHNLVIASDSSLYEQYQAKKETIGLSKEVLDMFQGKTSVFYFDIAGTLRNFASDSTSGYHHSLNTAVGTFKDVIASTDSFDGKSVQAKLEVRMQNQQQNSLVTLTSLLTDIAVDMRQQAKKRGESSFLPGGVPAIIRTN